MILRAMVLWCKMFLRIQMLSLFSHLLSEMNTFKCPQLDILLNTSDTQSHSFSFTLFIFLSACRRLSEALDTMVKLIQFLCTTSNTKHFCWISLKFCTFLVFLTRKPCKKLGHNFDHRTFEFMLCDHNDPQWLLTAVIQSSLVPI